MAKLKMSKRQRDAAKKRAAVMSSAEFQTWWEARRLIRPIPTDPYRSFMIDRGIVAMPFEKEVWRPRTNRADLIPVDIPMNMPARKIRSMSRKGQKRAQHFRQGYVPTTARPRPARTPEQTEIVALIEDMAKKYNTSVPQIFFEPNASAAYYRGDFKIKPFIRLSSTLKNKSQQKATAAHEMGHHVHHVGAEEILSNLNISAYLTAERNTKERAAWKIADPFMKTKRPNQKWFKKWALGTYLGTTPRQRRY